MKLRKFFTQIFITFAFVAVLSIFNIISLPIKVKAANVPVQLYYSQRIPDYNSYNTGHVEGYISVQNLAFEKKVTVHYTVDGNTWLDAPASYLKTNSSDNYEVWKFTTQSSYPLQPVVFCIKYEVNGQTYWDNNDGKNYTNTDIGKSSVFVSNISGSVESQDNHISLLISTKDFTETTETSKSVKLRYTEDNWKTYKDVPASFLNPIPINSISEWSSNINVSKSTKHVEFAVVYEVNGTEYWDNNFGSNYFINF